MDGFSSCTLALLFPIRQLRVWHFSGSSFPPVIMCSSLSAPLNGSITFVVDTTPTFDFMTAAMYKCDSGFALSGGDEVRICKEGPMEGVGEWSGTEPTCDRKIHAHIQND